MTISYLRKIQFFKELFTGMSTEWKTLHQKTLFFFFYVNAVDFYGHYCHIFKCNNINFLWDIKRQWCYLITHLPTVYLEPTMCLALQRVENNDEQTQHWSCQNTGKSTGFTHKVTLLCKLIKYLTQITSHTMVIITNSTY